jgi:hypothetical protein
MFKTIDLVLLFGLTVVSVYYIVIADCIYFVLNQLSCECTVF